MPQVPTLNGFSVSPTEGVNARVSAPTPIDNSGRQFAEAGGALLAAGGKAAELVTQAQAQANQLRVDDALNQVKERALDLTYDPNEGYQNLKGQDALHRPDGKSLQEEYGQQLQTAIDAQSESLGNDAQRRAFAAGTAGISQSFHSGLDQHYTSEFKTYTLSVDTGMIATAQREIALDPTNPETIERANLRIESAVARTMGLLGKSATEGEAATRQFKSQAYGMALSKMIDDNNLPLAKDFLARHREDMEADDIIKFDARVTDGVRAQDVNGFVTSLFSPTGAGGQATDFDRMVDITMGAGEGTHGRDTYANGASIVSPKGATGRMQVMPGTNLDPGYGIKPAQDNSPDERARVGRDYLAAMLKKYGSPDKAWAAYNAGPGRLDAALRDHPNDWLAHMPRETQNYVARTSKALGGESGGSGASRQSLTSLLTMARQRYADDPRALQLAEQQISSMYSAQEHDRDRNEEDTQNAAYAALYSNGGNLTPAIVASVPGKMLPSLQSYSSAIQAAAREPEKHGDPILWAGLKTQIANGQMRNPAQLLQYAPRLSNADYKDLTDDIIKVSSGDAKKIDSIKTTTSALKYVQQEMAAAGMDWKPEKGDKNYLEFQNAFYRQVQTLERTGGRPLTNDEARTVALKLLQEVPNSGGGWFSSNRRGFQLANPALPLSAIPADVRDRAAAALRANGKPVTETYIRWVIANPDEDIARRGPGK